MAILSLYKDDSAPNSSRAFDGLAEDYDRIFTHSQIGYMQRLQVWSVMEGFFRPGTRILELGCGTGYDALHLAQQGVSVLACDESPAMIHVAQAQANKKSYTSSLSFKVCANEHLNDLCGEELFDGAFSNFGSLNCSDNLRAVVSGLAKNVRPGGRILVCMINRFCLWEFLWFLCHAKFSKAVRRLHPNGSTAQIGEKKIRVLYPSVAKLRKLFAPEFSLAEWQGIGVAVPPSYVEPIFSYRSRALHRLGRLDEKIRKRPIARSIGDHILMEFVRKEA